MTQDNAPGPVPEKTQPTSPAAPGAPGAAPAPRRRKKRWIILSILAVLVVLLGLLLVLAPTIASTGFVRSMVVEQVNGMLNGRAEIQDWSIGWTSGIHVQGIRVYDADNRNILSIGEISTPMSLLKAASGNFALGDVQINKLDFFILLDKNGKLKISELLKPSNKSSSSGKLPNVSGTIHLNDATGTFQDDKHAQVVQFRSINGVVGIKDINQPIDDSLDLRMDMNNQSVGELKVDGNIAAIQNNQVDVEHVSGAQTIQALALNLPALNGILKSMAPGITLGGIANAKIAINLKSINDVAADAAITVDRLAVGIHGDSIKYNHVSIPLKASRASNGSTTQLKLDLPLVADQDHVDVHADMPEDALKETQDLLASITGRLLKGERGPTTQIAVGSGGAGSLLVSADINAAALAAQLPNTLHLNQGITLTSGQFTPKIDVQIGNGQAVVGSEIHLTNIAGTRNGSPIKMSDVNAVLGASAVGGASPDVKNLKLDVSSGFLNVKGGGENLGKTAFDGTFSLANLQQEASQFVDLTKVRLTGTGEFHVHTNGDFTAPDSDVAMDANLVLNDVNISGIANVKPVQEKNLTASISGNLHHSPTQFVQALHNAAITFQAQAIDFQAGGDVSLGAPVAASFEITKCNVNIPKLQQEFGGLLSVFLGKPAEGAKPSLLQRFADGSIHVTSGQLSAAAKGRYDPTSIGLDKPAEIRITNFDAQMDDEMGVPQDIREELALLTISGQGTTDASNNATIKNLTMVVQVGPDAARLVNVLLQADVNIAQKPGPAGPDGKPTTIMVVTAPQIQLKNCDVDLAQGQAKFGPLLAVVTPAPASGAAAAQPSLVQLLAQNIVVISSGKLGTSFSGSYDGSTLALSQPLTMTISDLTLRQKGAANSGVILREPMMRAIVRATVGMENQVPTSAKDASLTLQVGDDAAPTVAMEFNGDLTIKSVQTPGPDGKPVTSMSIMSPRYELKKCAVDLPKAQNEFAPLLALLMPAPAPVAGTTTPAAPSALDRFVKKEVVLDSGVLNASASGSYTDAGFVLNDSTAINIDHLTITEHDSATSRTPITDQSIHITAGATGTPDLKSISKAALTLDSSFAKVAVSNAVLLLSKTDIFDKLQSAHLKVDNADMGKMYALLSVLSPATPAVPAPAPAAGVTPTPPPAPLEILGGTATVDADINRQGQTTTITANTINLDGLSARRGKASYAWQKPITAKLVAGVDTADDPTGAAPLLSRLAKVSVTALSGDVGFATLGLSNQQPISITGIDDQQKMSVQFQIDIDGDIAQAARVIEVLTSGQPNAYPYQGHFHLTESAAKDAGKNSILLTGGGAVTAFKVLGSDGQPTFSEDEIAIANPVKVDVNKRPNGEVFHSLYFDQSQPVSITMKSSQALAITIVGQLLDAEQQRTFNPVTINASYDLEKLWKVIFPLLSPSMQTQFKDTVVSGKYTKPLNLGGSYPAGKPFNEAIKSLASWGVLTIGSISTNGITLANYEIPFTLKDGHLKTTYADHPDNGPLPASCNNGWFSMGIINVDLTGPVMLASIDNASQDHPLVIFKSITLNPALATNVLGKVVNNPAFDNSSQSQGLMDASILQFKNVPLSALATQDVPENKGVVDVTYSISGLVVGNPLIGQIIGFAGGRGDSYTNGEIKNATVHFEHARVTQDTTIMLDNKHPLRMYGTVGLADRQFQPMNISVPTSLLQNLIGQQNMKYVPDAITLPLVGSMSKPQLQTGGVIQNLVQDAAKKALLQGLIPGSGKNNNNNNGPTSQPSQDQDPLGNLFRDLTKPKKK